VISAYPMGNGRHIYVGVFKKSDHYFKDVHFNYTQRKGTHVSIETCFGLTLVQQSDVKTQIVGQRHRSHGRCSADSHRQYRRLY
jgi:hypothetical protein